MIRLGQKFHAPIAAPGRSIRRQKLGSSYPRIGHHQRVDSSRAWPVKRQLHRRTVCRKLVAAACRSAVELQSRIYTQHCQVARFA